MTRVQGLTGTGIIMLETVFRGHFEQVPGLRREIGRNEASVGKSCAREREQVPKGHQNRKRVSKESREKTRGPGKG